MDADLHSAMLHRLSDSAMFDFAAFLTCKPFLAAKDAKIIQAYCDELVAIDRPKNEPLRLLDVGSGEASLIEAICNRYLDVVPTRDSCTVRLVVDCVEPNPEGQTYLLDFARRASDRGIEVVPHDSTVEDFLSAERPDYHAILCCHSFYHINKDQWTSILRGLLRILSREGVLAVNLVSRSSDIYRIMDQLPKSEFERLPKTFESYGGRYYAEDMASVIGALDEKSRCMEISAPIAFPSHIISDYVWCMATGRGGESILVRFLAFMFRLRSEDLASIGKGVLVPHACGISTLSFKSVDHLYTVRRRCP